MNDREKLKQEFINAAMNSDEYKNELPEVKKGPGKAPFIAGALLLVAIIVLIVVFIGLNEKKNSAPAGNGETAKEGQTGEADASAGSVEKIGDYKNFSYAAYTGEISDEQVEDQYRQMVETYKNTMGSMIYTKDDSRDTSTVKEGDVVNVDITPYIEGVEVDGAVEKYDYTVEKAPFNEMSDIIRSNMNGMSVGETKEFNIDFEENYYNDTYAGKTVTLSVTVNYINKSEEVTEENAYSAVLGTDSLEEAYEEIREFLKEYGAGDEKTYMDGVKDSYTAQIMEGSEFTVSEEAVQKRYDAVYSMFEESAASAGEELSEYAGKSGFSSLEEMESFFKEEARKLIGSELIYAEIAKAEGISVSEEEIEERTLSYTSENGYSDASAYVSQYDKIYGQGSLKAYMESLCIRDRLFDMYAKEK